MIETLDQESNAVKSNLGTVGEDAKKHFQAAGEDSQKNMENMTDTVELLEK